MKIEIKRKGTKHAILLNGEDITRYVSSYELSAKWEKVILNINLFPDELDVNCEE